MGALESVAFWVTFIVAPVSGQALSTSPVLSTTRPATAATTQPTAINLDLQTVPAEEAFEALAQQAGVEIAPANADLWTTADPISLKIRNGRFWPVLVSLCRQSRVSFIDYSETPRGRSVVLTAVGQSGRDLDRLQVCESDAFVLIPTHSSRGGSLSYDKPESASHYLNVNVRVFSDPGVGPFTLLGPATITEAADERGASLVPPRGLGGSGGNQPASLAQTIMLRLNCPPEVGRRIAVLKGSLRLNAVWRNELIEWDAPFGKTPLKRAVMGAMLYLYPMKVVEGEEGRLYQLTVAFRTREGGGGIVRRLDGRDLQSMLYGIALTDSRQRRLRVQRIVATGDNFANYEYTVDFRPVGPAEEPANLSWRIPAESRTSVVPFEFKDLPIP